MSEYDIPIEAGQPVRVTQGMPDVTVRVLDGVVMKHDGIAYSAGDTFVCSGPLAEAFAFDGAVEILPI